MNVYDFDKTIYAGDSTIDFYIYCVKRFPKIALFLPKQLAALIEYKLKIIDKTKMKEKFYCFFKSIPEINCIIKDFWDINEHKVEKWYKKQKQNDDIIISASPDILLREICMRMEIKYLIASRVDSKTGKYNGLNCYGEEKVLRFYTQFPTMCIDKFYSDSYSDEPLAKIAKESFIVSKGTIKKWPEKQKKE